MGKTNPRKRLWIEAAKKFILKWLSVYGLNICQMATLKVLDFFAAKSRERKNARDRNKVWYEQLRDYVVKQMLLQGIAERKTEYGSTYYMIEPNLTMGKDKDGTRRFQNLMDVVGLVEAEKLVNVTVRHIPAHEVKVTVRDFRFQGGKVQSQTETVPERAEWEYTFVSSGSTAELLFWTVAMGNKPTYDVGPAPKRVKEGKKRRRR
jgi:hypothetical protein